MGVIAGTQEELDNYIVPLKCFYIRIAVLRLDETTTHIHATAVPVINTPNKLKLSVNGQNIFNWFKQKYQELKQVIKPHIQPKVVKKRF